MDELLIEELRQAQVFPLEALASFVDGFDACKELLIQEQSILMIGEQRGRLFIDLLQLFSAVCAHQS